MVDRIGFLFASLGVTATCTQLVLTPFSLGSLIRDGEGGWGSTPARVPSKEWQYDVNKVLDISLLSFHFNGNKPDSVKETPASSPNPCLFLISSQNVRRSLNEKDAVLTE